MLSFLTGLATTVTCLVFSGELHYKIVTFANVIMATGESNAPKPVLVEYSTRVVVMATVRDKQESAFAISTGKETRTVHRAVPAGMAEGVSLL